MRSWYHRIAVDQGGPALITEALAFFEQEYNEACAELDALPGQRLVEVNAKLPGIVGYRYAQLKELDAIIEYLAIREDGTLGAKRRHYVEHYNRTLTATMVEKYAETDPDVLGWRELRNHVTLVRDKYDALSKRHDYLKYRLGDIRALLVAGIEDAVL